VGVDPEAGDGEVADAVAVHVARVGDLRLERDALHGRDDGRDLRAARPEKTYTFDDRSGLLQSQ
jgi:hypothetical protein